MNKLKSPVHKYWQPRVEGQIRDALHQHPEWFTDVGKRSVVRSLAKRIIGEICAGASLAPMSVGVDRVTCADPKARGDGVPTAVTTRPERDRALRSGRGAKFIIAAIIALAALPLHAHATEWYILNEITAQCERAELHSPALQSPAALEFAARTTTGGNFQGTTINRDDNGRIDMVFVRAFGLITAYLPSLEKCQFARMVGLRTGLLR